MRKIINNSIFDLEEECPKCKINIRCYIRDDITTFFCPNCAKHFSWGYITVIPELLSFFEEKNSEKIGVN